MKIADLGATRSQAGSGGGLDLESLGRASLLPPPPPAVPLDLTRASRRYQRHAWLAVLGLLLFVAAYLSLTGWFSFTAYRLFRDLFQGGEDGFWDVVGGATSTLLAVFLLKALFFIKSGGKPSDLEVTAEDEPALFAFLNALADRAGAPRPHRVFLSMRVNAAVFYDLSLINLLLPTRKNLEIGLGLVNTLTLSEMTAVLAHEFGHFAQRSMAVGRWVYIAQQVAGQIVATRGWLDKVLAAISTIDIRVAWIGWILRLIVWSIRSLLDTVFGLVLLAQRALGREMEFQADLVSVSLAGSDALVHALHRLGAADDAWSNAISVASTELAKGHAVPDLFALQTRIIERMATVLNEPNHGASPVRPSSAPHEHRVFELELAEPPRMWSTHPANRDREDNAKRVYVLAELDPRPAWCLFTDAANLKLRATARIIAENADEKQKPELISNEAALGAVDKRFARPYLEQRYRGAYLGRSIVLHEKTPTSMYDATVAPDSLSQLLSELYPEQLSSDVRDLKLRLEERANLEALRDGLLDAPGGVIRHRGRVIQRRALAAVLEQVSGEAEAVRQRVEAHDRLCRSSHRAAARQLGQGWEPYLHGLGKLLHYAGHAEANLEDARGHLANVFAVVTADGRVSDSERRRLVMAATEVHTALCELFEHKDDISLPPLALERLNDQLGVAGGEDECQHWGDALPKDFQLPAPAESNIGDWLQVIDSWVNGALHGVGALERVALELLVETEQRVCRAYLEQADPGPAPPAPVVPPRYQTLAKGEERARQKKLDWWDRFQTADGFLPSAARFVVAGGILGCVLGFGSAVGHPTVTVVNGLGVAVDVQIGDQTVLLEPRQHRLLELAKERLQITARTHGGEQLESFSETAEGSQRYVYNVAGGAPLVQWTAVYGSAAEVPNRRLGSLVWLPVNYDVLFEDPPREVKIKGGGAVRSVLTAVMDVAPGRALSLVESEAERRHMVQVHAEWDQPGTRTVQGWVELLQGFPDAARIVQRRLKHYPGDVTALRAEQDVARAPEKQQVCTRHRARSEATPQDLDLRYLALRCADDDPAADQQLLQEFRENPEHSYLANAAGYELCRRRDYVGAEAAFEVAARALPLQDDANLFRARLDRVMRQTTPPGEGGVGLGLASQLEALAHDSSQLELLLRHETGKDAKPPYTAYMQLAQGDLSGAVATAEKEPELYRIVLRLAGASDDASSEIVQDALSLPENAGIDHDTVWPAIALAEREQKAHAAFDEAANKMYPDGQAPLMFADAKFLSGDAVAVETALFKLRPELQAYACVMALVRQADKAPAPCRALAKGFLFASERPYFR